MAVQPDQLESPYRSFGTRVCRCVFFIVNRMARVSLRQCRWMKRGAAAFAIWSISDTAKGCWSTEALWSDDLVISGWVAGLRERGFGRGLDSETHVPRSRAAGPGWQAARGGGDCGRTVVTGWSGLPSRSRAWGRKSANLVVGLTGPRSPPIPIPDLTPSANPVGRMAGECRTSG